MLNWTGDVFSNKRLFIIADNNNCSVNVLCIQTRCTRSLVHFQSGVDVRGQNCTVHWSRTIVLVTKAMRYVTRMWISVRGREREREKESKRGKEKEKWSKGFGYKRIECAKGETIVKKKRFFLCSYQMVPKNSFLQFSYLDLWTVDSNIIIRDSSFLEAEKKTPPPVTWDESEEFTRDLRHRNMTSPIISSICGSRERLIIEKSGLTPFYRKLNNFIPYNKMKME